METTKVNNDWRKSVELYRVKKQCKLQNDRMKDMVGLIQMVSPAIVYHVNLVGKHSHPSLTLFAKRNNYDHHKLLRLLQRERVMEKVNGTWILAPEYRHAGLVFYTIGRRNRYGTLDMYLLPDGEEFMQAFMKAHPIKHREKKQ